MVNFELGGRITAVFLFSSIELTILINSLLSIFINDGTVFNSTYAVFNSTLKGHIVLICISALYQFWEMRLNLELCFNSSSNKFTLQ